MLMAVPSRNPVGFAGKDATGILHPACCHRCRDCTRGPGAWGAGRPGSCNGRCISTNGVCRMGSLIGSEVQNSEHSPSRLSPKMLSAQPARLRNAWISLRWKRSTWCWFSYSPAIVGLLPVASSMPLPLKWKCGILSARVAILNTTSLNPMRVPTGSLLLHQYLRCI